MDFDIASEAGTHLGQVLLIGALAFFFKRQLRVYDEHLTQCNEIPKRTIVEKLDDLSTSVRDMAKTQKEQGELLATLHGRQIERDHRA